MTEQKMNTSKYISNFFHVILLDIFYFVFILILQVNLKNIKQEKWAMTLFSV